MPNEIIQELSKLYNMKLKQIKNLPELDDLKKKLGHIYLDLIDAAVELYDNFTIKKTKDGTIWISFVTGDKPYESVISMVYHKTRPHRAITFAHNGIKKSKVEPPKIWAVSIQRKGIWLNKTGYDL